MPYYTFKCTSCSQELELKQKMSDPAPVCLRCAEASLGVHVPNMVRVFKNIGKPQFKGKGFYETDYKTKKR